MCSGRPRNSGRSAEALPQIDRAIRGVTPALSARRRPLHRRLSESEKPTASPQRSPETRKQVSRLFRRCALFDWRFFGFGFLAMLIRGVHEPSALLHALGNRAQRALLVMPVHSMELSRRGLATEDELSVTRRIRPSSHKPRRVLGVGGWAACGWLPGGVADCYRFMLAEISSEARRLSKRARIGHL
jgi:hypothetical protein